MREIWKAFATERERKMESERERESREDRE